MNKEKNFVSAVIYVHNAERELDAFLRTVRDTLVENFEHSEIICVNDASDDNSLDIIRKIAKEETEVSISVVNMSYFQGLELSMNAGDDIAIGDFVFEFDLTQPDFDKNIIMEVYSKSLQGYDVVSAVPDRKERLSSRIFYYVFDRFTEFSYKMHTESFRVLSRRVLNRVESMNKTVPYRKAVYAEAGLKTERVVYTPSEGQDRGVLDRKARKYRRGLAIDLMILFTEMGFRFSIQMTCAMMFISVFMTVYSLIIYLSAHPVEGWTTTVLFLSVAFFGLFAILTIIVKYLQLIVNLIFRRKTYSYDSIEKMTK